MDDFMGNVHPMTCGNDSSHVLVATDDGWMCPVEGCGYVQLNQWRTNRMSRTGTAVIEHMNRVADLEALRALLLDCRAAADSLQAEYSEQGNKSGALWALGVSDRILEHLEYLKQQEATWTA